ncbi:MAG TPA: DNA polymerase [Bradyrhizobium sp.]|uniref:DNA polymerase n=1 Tax=Bradyrhizobium sp. TaxID=376 RepID=UPI002C2E30E0|nr:DNA polymerase [Bradyrhizobium sp.]HXB81201.1 DNA polymerase [Bradyrhizobium sp.]
MLDFEFEVGHGERPVPVCLVAKELRSNRTHRVFQGEFGAAPPYAAGPDVLFVAYYASAELGCYRVLGWQLPERILDLFVEFRNLINGLSTPAGAGLLGALTYFGLDGMGATTKKELQEAIGTGTWLGQYTADEILDYCESDVLALERLLPVMLPNIDLPRALLRGRYMAAAAAIEHAGVPIDTTTLHKLRDRWVSIQDQLIAGIDAQYHVYEGRTFKQERFAQFLQSRGIPWPRLVSGALDLGDDTFRQMAKAYPAISPLRELRSALSELRLNDLAVGHDGRNRTILSAFRSRSGRNQPSNAKSIFGPSVWLRGLIKPPPDCAVAYIDWSQQEFGIAGALSGDTAMQEAYRSGDPYLTFAKQARAVPDNATKASHPGPRELFKQCVLATQYGMEAESLAARIGQPPIVARDLLRMHRETYSRFWAWSDAALDHAMLRGSLYTVFGWHVHVGQISNPRSLRNFPMQANGAEMLRLACCLAVERGVEICAPVHDAVLICAPEQGLGADVETMRAAMAEASRIVLGGFELGTDVEITRWPDRYMDKRGSVMWERVMGLIGNGND